MGTFLCCTSHDVMHSISVRTSIQDSWALFRSWLQATMKDVFPLPKTGLLTLSDNEQKETEQACLLSISAS